MALCALPAACGSYPRDVDGTLDAVYERGALRVAFGHVPERERSRARQFLDNVLRATSAREQIVDFGSDEAMLAALEDGQIDLIVAEIADDSPWIAEVAVTEPIATRRVGKRRLGVSAIARNGESAWVMLLEGEVRDMNGARLTERAGHPPQIERDIRAARRLEWWNIAWTVSIIAAMGLAMGSSQAMKTAWVEDTLGLIPPIVFLIATRYEARAADRRFNYGYDRVNSLGFLIAAVALGGVGFFLLKDALVSLWQQEHVTIGSARVLGHDVWLGWFMLAAQAYATIPPLIIGRKELPLAERLRDKLIHTDALMNKANWQTGIAGIVGVTGLGFGLWWADSAAAAAISLSILWDAWNALRIATSELVDGIPLKLGDERMSDEAMAVATVLQARFPEARAVLLRETGRYIRAEVIGAIPPEGFFRR